MASAIFILKSMILINCCKTVVIMRAPPGDPVASICPCCVDTITGVIELNGRLPGAIALASPPIRPNAFGTPGLIEKSSISLLSNTPVPRATIPEPKFKFNVYVQLTTLPAVSITEKCVVWSLSKACGCPGLTVALGVARSSLIFTASSSAYFFEVKPFCGTFTKSGSPKYSARSA